MSDTLASWIGMHSVEDCPGSIVSFWCSTFYHTSTYGKGLFPAKADHLDVVAWIRTHGVNCYARKANQLGIRIRFIHFRLASRQDTWSYVVSLVKNMGFMVNLKHRPGPSSLLFSTWLILSHEFCQWRSYNQISSIHHPRCHLCTQLRGIWQKVLLIRTTSGALKSTSIAPFSQSRWLLLGTPIVPAGPADYHYSYATKVSEK